MHIKEINFWFSLKYEGHMFSSIYQKGVTLTYLSQMEFPTLINGTSLLPFKDY